MQKIFLALAATAAAATFGGTPSPAHARDYPWCAQYSERMGGGRNCGFVSFQQCQATVQGAGGFCEPNPRYTSGRGYRRHYRRDQSPYYRD
jgi:Protein of unknown function (DUF3551)